MNAAMELEAGAYCNLPGDGVQVAPATHAGVTTIFDTPYRFALLGDRIPAVRDLGLGVVGRLKSFVPGETLIAQVRRVEDMGPVDLWRFDIKDDGRFWLGTAPLQGGELDYGTYQVAVYRGQKALLIYEFDVVPAKSEAEAKAICVPDIS
jgi:hypothetical protein